MTAADLRDLFTRTLVRQVGGTARQWKLVMGEVKIYSIETHPHCNWAITPAGRAREIAEVERVADDLRLRHPIIRG